MVHRFHYIGTLVKVGDRFISKTHLDNRPTLQPYIKGKAHMSEYNSKSSGWSDSKEAQSTHEWHKYVDGEYWVFKEMVRQDLIIQQDRNGIWINNAFYRRIK